MKQEPVAWAIKADGDFTEIGFDNDLLEEVEEIYAMEGWKYEVVPLYTTPQIKELSNEEIDEIASMCSVNESGQINTREFARAILKKASFTCNGFCGEQECKEHQAGCKRIKKASEK